MFYLKFLLAGDSYPQKLKSYQPVAL